MGEFTSPDIAIRYIENKEKTIKLKIESNINSDKAKLYWYSPHGEYVYAQSFELANPVIDRLVKETIEDYCRKG